VTLSVCRFSVSVSVFPVDAIDRSPLTAGRGRVFHDLAPWPDQERLAEWTALPAGPCGGSALFGNPVVGHTRITHPREVERIGFFRSASISRNRVSGNSPLQYSELQVVGCKLLVKKGESFPASHLSLATSDSKKIGCARRDVARAVSKNPYGSMRD
jgi:hypothetical protein